jgi:NADPH:quinone reductase-like Zn-dependent oxidoreductase
MNGNTMRALVLEQYNTPFAMRTLTRPSPKAGEILVRIHASGINPLDVKIRSGAAAHARTNLPAILGMDVAGTVEAIGDKVSGFTIGDRVYGMAGGIGGVPGSMAEFGAFDADLLAKMPANLSMREAAALPLIFITAWEGLVDRANVRAGQKVLIHGGAGGVGHVAVQIALARGAKVYATGSAGQTAYIESLGATAIDYRSTTVEQYVEQHTDGEGFDIVYDTVGGTTLDASFLAAKAYVGHVISCLGWGTHSLAPLSFRAASYSGVFTLMPLLTGKGRAHHGEIMHEASALVEQEKLQVRVDTHRFTFDNATDAHLAIENRTATGKIVIDVSA